jgi:hypothetical protein
MHTKNNPSVLLLTPVMLELDGIVLIFHLPWKYLEVSIVEMHGGRQDARHNWSVIVHHAIKELLLEIFFFFDDFLFVDKVFVLSYELFRTHSHQIVLLSAEMHL